MAGAAASHRCAWMDCPFHPVWWLSVRDFLTPSEIQRLLKTSYTGVFGISYFEKVFKHRFHETISQGLHQTMEQRPPELLMQRLGAGGHEDAMWMKLHQYLDKDSLPQCFLTCRGDADVFLEVRQWRQCLNASSMRELLTTDTMEGKQTEGHREHLKQLQYLLGMETGE